MAKCALWGLRGRTYIAFCFDRFRAMARSAEAKAGTKDYVSNV